MTRPLPRWYRRRTRPDLDAVEVRDGLGRVLRRVLGAEYPGDCPRCGGVRVEDVDGRYCPTCRRLTPVPLFGPDVHTNGQRQERKP